MKFTFFFIASTTIYYDSRVSESARVMVFGSVELDI